MNPPRQPSSMPPPTTATQSSQRQEREGRQPNRLGRHLPVAQAHGGEHPPEQQQRDECPRSALEDAFDHERPADVGERGTDELHDFNFVMARGGRQPDDVRDRQRRGRGEQDDDEQSDPPDEPDDGVQPVQPAAVVAHVRDAVDPAQGCGQRVDGLVRFAHLRLEAHVERGRKRIGIETLGGRRQVRKVALEPRRRLLLGHVLAGGRQAALPDQFIDHRQLLTGHVIGQVHRELRGFRPPRDEPLQVGVEHEEEAEDEQPGSNRQDGQRGGAPAAPQAAPGLGEEIPERAH